MKTIVRSLCIAGLLLGGANLLRAEDKVPAAEAPKKHQTEALTPEQREARRKEAKAKFEAQLKELRDKKAAGKLTEEEAKKLEHLEKRAKAKEKKAGQAEHEHKAETK
jgi:hypothetical protein